MYGEIINATKLSDGWYRFGVRFCNEKGEPLIKAFGLRFDPEQKKIRDACVKWSNTGGSHKSWVSIVEVQPMGRTLLRTALERLIPRLQDIYNSNSSLPSSKINAITRLETEVFFGTKPEGIQEDSDDE